MKTRWWIRIVSVAAAMAVWLLVLPRLFDPDHKTERSDRLAAHHIHAFAHDDAGATLRIGNPEWDLMRRMFTVLALADRVVADDDVAASLSAIDAIVADTLDEHAAHGSYHFLLGYARARPWRYEESRSLFVDGEITMMLAARQLAAPNAATAPRLRRWMSRVAEQMTAGPITCGESYPDECWTFCNTTALAALRLGDAALGTDHSELSRRWLADAKKHLLNPATGLLASSYSHNGAIADGPEGSSIWMTAHNLRLIDDTFARDQYRRAKEQLAIEIDGFGLAREWPTTAMGRMDIDSGPVIPILGASAGSSGLALLGAASFGDDAYFDSLVRSLSLAAFPIREEGRLRYGAAGPMGDAVAFAAHTAGPLWERAIAQLQRQGRDST